MTTATDMLSRARALRRPGTQQASAPMRAAPPAAPAMPVATAAQTQVAAQVLVHPPEIPPMVPMPKPRATIYKGLMHKHDRVATRHLPT